MEAADILEYFDPQEYEGLVFDMPAESIGRNLAIEVARVGSMELWEYQSFVNHDHPAMGPDANPVEIEPFYALVWRQALSDRFPSFSFVIETSPMDRMTWFQLTRTAPTEDDDKFQDYSPPIALSMSEFQKSIKQMNDEGIGSEEARETYMANFRSRTPRRGNVGSCEKCESNSGFTEPVVSEKHRGIRLMRCLTCEAELIHSTKTIREVIAATFAK